MTSLLLRSELRPYDIEMPAAKQEINQAWERYTQSSIKHFKDGLGFGQACCHWQERYKAQGSRTGKGFEQLLGQLHIPKTTAYRWIRRYEMRSGLRAERHEVTKAHTMANKRKATVKQRDESFVSFVFLLTDGEERAFRQSVAILGGQAEVSRMFVEFISQKAFERGCYQVHRDASPTASTI